MKHTHFQVAIEQAKEDIDSKAPELSHLKERLNQIYFFYENYEDVAIKDACIREFNKNIQAIYSKNNSRPTYEVFGG